MSQIANIEIFSYMTHKQVEKIESLFEEYRFEQGHPVISHSNPVAGLYLIEEGEVDITIPGFEGKLAVLGKGSSFGEMSLFKEDARASATVTVSSEGAGLYFCKREYLLELLDRDTAIAVSFHKGSAAMVVDRLRSNNEKISHEISKSMQTASDMLSEFTSIKKLGVARDEVDHAGESIVAGITQVMRELTQMSKAEHPVPQDRAADLLATIKQMYYDELQVFDRVSQQLHLLEQQLNNVSRILSFEGEIEVTGDVALLDR